MPKLYLNINPQEKRLGGRIGGVKSKAEEILLRLKVRAQLMSLDNFGRKAKLVGFT